MKNRDVLTKSLYTTKMVVCKDFRGIFPVLGERAEFNMNLDRQSSVE